MKDMVVDIRHLKEISHPLIQSYLSHGIQGDDLVENHQHIVLPYADIQSREWYFDGIRIGYSDWNYNDHVTLKWSFDIHAELITMFINMKGLLRFSGNSDTGFSMGSSQHNLFYAAPGEADEGMLFPEEERLRMFMIQFPKNLFVKLISDANEVLGRFREQIWNAQSAALSFENRYLDIPMRNCIQSIVNCKYQGGIKKIYLLSKVMEMLVLQAEAFNEKTDNPKNIIRTDYDKERIHYAMEWLNQHLPAPPSLSELSKMAGLNEFKLKKGFKEVFGTTVFGYVAEARLKLALDELLENRKQVQEVAANLGYSSVNHFSKAFKTKYGIPPSQVFSKYSLLNKKAL